MNKNPLCVVSWEDAVGFDNMSEEDVLKEKPSIVQTFGAVILTKKYCIIQTHDSCQRDSDDFMRIPRELVRKITRVTEWTKQKRSEGSH